jgi:DNA adenine methylase
LFTQDPHDKIEIVNDLNEELITFWRVLRNPLTFEKLMRRLQTTPYSEIEFLEAKQPTDDAIERAARFFILSRQSLSARQESFAPITKTRLRRHMCDNVSAWLSAIDGLPEVQKRLESVIIFNRPAIEIISEHDEEGAFVLADPPWLHSSRTSTKEYGKHEMTDEQHTDLLIMLTAAKSKVMLLGYHSKLYDTMLANWTCHEFPMANHSGIGKKKQQRTPCVWLNY